jgi:V/A-type H+-transporting ATPase subunit B
MVRTGIPMIDVFNTLVESQKLPIFSVAGEPYNPCWRASRCRPRWT